MATALVATYEVKPGRLEGFNAAMGEQRELLESIGASVRVWMTMLAGPNSGRVIVVSEYDDNAALGAGIDALMAKAPMPIQKVLAGENPAAARVSLGTLQEIG